MVVEKQLTTKEKLFNVIYLAIPATMALFLGYLPEIINLSMIGQKYDTYSVNAISLCNIIIALLPFTLMYGINGALDTLMSQAYGAQDYELAGHFLNAGRFLMAVIYVPMFVVMLFTGAILRAFG